MLANGREHGAAIEGARISRHGGLRCEPRELRQSWRPNSACAACQDLSQVTAESDVIITVVTDDNAMREMFAASGDNLLVNARGKLFINCATISPEVHVEVEKLAESAGAQTLEACMASSITQAREGSLYLMCGGREENFKQAEPILKELGIDRCVTSANRAKRRK